MVGYGAVTRHGYGIGYVAKPHGIYACLTSFRAEPDMGESGGGFGGVKAEEENVAAAHQEVIGGEGA